MDNQADAVFEGEGGDLLGSSLASGDVNSDGVDDIIAASSYKAYIWFGGIEIDTVTDIVLNPSELVGEVACGDLNGDGFDDIITRGVTDGYRKTFVFYGSLQPDDSFDVLIEPMSGAYATGYFNRDRYYDLLIGDPGAYGDLGAIYMFFWGVILWTTTMIGEAGVPVVGGLVLRWPMRGM